MQNAKIAYTRRKHFVTPIWRIKGHHYQSGVELLELLIVLAIIGVVAFIAVPIYTSYRDKVNIATAVADITTIEHSIEQYYQENNSYPDFLVDVKKASLLDPWKHPYQYLRIAGANLKGLGALRKDKNRVPINTDYDLYSMGKDGKSVSPLTAKMSRDDIVRAYNGKFIGLAKDLI